MKKRIVLSVALSLCMLLPSCKDNSNSSVSGTTADSTVSNNVTISDTVTSETAELTDICSDTSCETFSTSSCAETGETAEHLWNDATCTSPQICSKCGETNGEALGHTWNDATCDSPQTCSRCGETSGEALGHVWNDATCTSAQSCSRCGGTNGWELGHAWIGATCSSAQTCSRCGITEGSALDHWWRKTVTVAATPTVEGQMTYTCAYCNESYTKNTGTYNFNPELCGDPYHIRSSENPDNFVDFKIEGNVLRISGKIAQSGLISVMLQCGDSRKFIDVSEGQAFSEDLSLDSVSQKTFVKAYTKRQGDSEYWGYIFDSLSIIPDGSGYRFESSMVLQNNLGYMQTWINPADCLSDPISQQIRDLSNSIVGGETNDYKKMQLLNKWVAENIYYDYDFYEGRSSEVFYGSDEVYLNKRSVCEGYAGLLELLLQAQGIPAIQVSTYSAGQDTLGYFDSSNYQAQVSNHSHVEAYLRSEDRWVIMDATWDSGNKYINGQYISGPFKNAYFDMSFDMFAYTHKILSRG